jgi:membrane protease subunit HflK
MRRFFLWLPVVLLGLYLLTGLTQIQPNERAIVRRFGKVLENKPTPGLYVGLPWGMDRVDRIQVDKVQSVTFGYLREEEETLAGTPAGQYLTGDRNLVNIRVALDYTADDQALEDYLEQSALAEGVLQRAGESVLVEWLAARRVEEVLLPDNAAIQSKFIGEIQQRIAPYRLGVLIRSVSIVQREVPAQVKDAFDDVTKAMQERGTREMEARQYESSIVSKARSDANQTRQNAEVYYHDQVNKAQVDRESFQQHLKNAPQPGKERDEYLRLIWWQEIGNALIELKKDGRLKDVDPFVTRNGLEIILPMPMRAKSN